MMQAFEVGPRGATIVRCGLSLLLLLGTACPGDDGEDTGGGTTGGMTTMPGETTVAEPTGGPGTTVGEDTTTTTTTPTTATTEADETTQGMEETVGEDTTTGEPPVEVPFSEVLSIIQAECSCHRSGAPPAGLDLSDGAAYGSLVSVPSTQAPGVNRVEPGDPDNSYLYRKLLGEQAQVGGSGVRMPAGGAPPLPQDQLDVVRDWILGGAQP
jgi:hypothetical protein